MCGYVEGEASGVAGSDRSGGFVAGGAFGGGGGGGCHDQDGEEYDDQSRGCLI